MDTNINIAVLNSAKQNQHFFPLSYRAKCRNETVSRDFFAIFIFHESNPPYRRLSNSLINSIARSVCLRGVVSIFFLRAREEANSGYVAGKNHARQY